MLLPSITVSSVCPSSMDMQTFYFTVKGQMNLNKPKLEQNLLNNIYSAVSDLFARDVPPHENM